VRLRVSTGDGVTQQQHEFGGQRARDGHDDCHDSRLRYRRGSIRALPNSARGPQEEPQEGGRENRPFDVPRLQEAARLVRVFCRRLTLVTGLSSVGSARTAVVGRRAGFAEAAKFSIRGHVLLFCGLSTLRIARSIQENLPHTTGEETGEMLASRSELMNRVYKKNSMVYEFANKNAHQFVIENARSSKSPPQKAPRSIAACSMSRSCKKRWPPCPSTAHLPRDGEAAPQRAGDVRPGAGDEERKRRPRRLEGPVFTCARLPAAKRR